jgi:hypothetical protein
VTEDGKESPDWDRHEWTGKDARHKADPNRLERHGAGRRGARGGTRTGLRARLAQPIGVTRRARRTGFPEEKQPGGRTPVSWR